MIRNIVKVVEAAPGEEGQIEVFTVKDAQKFRIHRVMFHFPAGTGYLLEIALFYGLDQLCPDVGWATGDNNQYSLSEDKELTSGDKLIIKYKNNDTTNSHKALVVVEGELFE